MDQLTEWWTDGQTDKWTSYNHIYVRFAPAKPNYLAVKVAIVIVTSRVLLSCIAS